MTTGRHLHERALCRSFGVRSFAGVVITGAAAFACTTPEDVVGSVDRDTGSAGKPGGGCIDGAPVRQRPEGEPITLTAGMFESATEANWVLLRRAQYLSLEGQGYLALRWQIEYRVKAGLITPPRIDVTAGSYVYVGGGGGVNLGDPEPGTTGTYMGNAEEGLSTMPEGVPAPWRNEFYYLDGAVTITQSETDGLYNVIVYPQTYEDLLLPGWGIYNPGVVCDSA